jgi:hypothetical protein
MGHRAKLKKLRHHQDKLHLERLNAILKRYQGPVEECAIEVWTTTLSEEERAVLDKEAFIEECVCQRLVDDI